MPNLTSVYPENLEYLYVCQEMFFIAKQLYDYDPQKAVNVMGNYLDYDFYSEMMFDALNACFDTFIIQDTRSDMSHFYFSDPIILDYYTLCARHAKLSGVSYKKDPFYQKAIRSVQNNLDDVCSTVCAYMTCSLSANPERKDRCGLAITSEYYCADYAPFVSAMIDIIEFYDITREKLREEIVRLEQMQRGLIVVPSKKRISRKGIKAA